MKRIIFYGFIASLFLFSKSYAQEVTFKYDAAGNQIEEKLVCINCTTVASHPIVSDTLKAQFNTTINRFSAYPNPVQEILNIKLESITKETIKSIEVYAVNGAKVLSKKVNDNEAETSISFFNLQAGMYVLRVYFSDKTVETLKVVKQ